MSAWMARGMSLMGIGFMRLLALLPLTWLRAFGAAFGAMLWLIVPRRKHIASVNWLLYQTHQQSHQQSHQVSQHQTQLTRRPTLEIFVYFAQAWLDRSWLWHAPAKTLSRRLRVTGQVKELFGSDPVVVFAPHFVGLDAAWTALTCPQVNGAANKAWATIYTDQSNKVVDAWILRGRQRFAPTSAHARAHGTKPVLATLKRGGALYLLPDMDFGADGAVFAPLFGTPAATVTSLARFARLGRAVVISVSTELTPSGYEVTVHPAWTDFPSADPVADATRMNDELVKLIDRHPTQYWWLHKRFKTRPEGQKSLY